MVDRLRENGGLHLGTGRSVFGFCSVRVGFAFLE